MSRSPRGLPVLVALLVVPWLPGGAAAQTPAALTPAPPASATVEVDTAEGAANPIGAPLLGAGSVVDTILETETLWYAVDARPGQRVGATVLVGGRPDGPLATDAVLQVTLTDAQRQPLDVRQVPFTGQGDGVVEVPAVALPDVVGDAPLLSVSLRPGSGGARLASTGYRLQLTLVVTGQPLPQVSAAPQPVSPDAPQAPDVTVTSPPLPPPAAPDLVGDLLPVALIALAVGGFAGFELSRRGL